MILITNLAPVFPRQHSGSNNIEYILSVAEVLKVTINSNFMNYS